MIKSKLIELCLRQANQDGVGIVDSIKRVTPRQCELAISNIWSDMLFFLLKDSQSIDFFCKTYNDISIDYSSNTKEYTVDLPIDICQLPMNKGLHLVRGVGSNSKFFATTNEDLDLFSNMDSAYYDRTLYLLNGTSQIKLVNFDYASHNIRKVQLKLIPSFMSYEWTEEIPIPSGRVSDLVSIIAKSLFQGKKFLDGSSDGVTA